MRAGANTINILYCRNQWVCVCVRYYFRLICAIISLSDGCCCCCCCKKGYRYKNRWCPLISNYSRSVRDEFCSLNEKKKILTKKNRTIEHFRKCGVRQKKMCVKILMHRKNQSHTHTPCECIAKEINEKNEPSWLMLGMLKILPIYADFMRQVTAQSAWIVCECFSLSLSLAISR